MARHSNLGPIDPYFGSWPAHGVIQEFKRACREVKKDPSRIAIWQPIIRQYQPGFLSKCENAKKWAAEFVHRQLADVMFFGEKDAQKKAKTIVKKLSDFSGNRAHDRHIHFEEYTGMGLKVSLIEDDQQLQDLVLTVHHCFMHTLMNTAAFKIIENHNGSAIVKQQQMIQAMKPV